MQYELDAYDHITAVDKDWDVFATVNGAPHLSGGAVVGDSIWTHITGKESQYIHQELFAKARQTQQTVSVPFRCDAPHERRFLCMDITPGPHDHLVIRINIIKLDPRPAVALLSQERPALDEYLKVCSWCKSVQLPDGNWVEVEQAVELLGLFDGPLPRISHGICQGCLHRFSEELGLDLGQ